MLSRIVVLNSKLYGKAEIRMDDCDSLQLVGPNNIGKSTLIYALNFLFIVDGNKMTFSGNRRGDKDTIHHYFPSPNNSFIVFEVTKKGHYCILVKRDSEGELEYFKFETPYREEHFFVTEKGGQRLMDFDEIKETLSNEGFPPMQFRTKTDVFNYVYQRGRKNNSVVWLEDTVKTEGLSNNFSKVYRYLINTKLINNKSLKEALIISDNRENDNLNFSQKNKKDIADLLKINQQIRAIRHIKEDFLAFRDKVNLYNSKTNVVRELLYAFNHNYAKIVPELEQKAIKKDTDITKVKTELHEVLKPRENELNQRMGEKISDVRNKAQFFDHLDKELKEINAFEPEKFLLEALENLDKKRKEIEVSVTQIENQNYTADQLKGRIAALDAEIDQLATQIKNYEDLLINQISDQPEVRKLMNSVFSEQMKSLPGKQVVSKITKKGKTLKIFDGEIDISKNLELEEFRSAEEIKSELEYKTKERDSLQKIYKVVKDLDKAQKDLTQVKSEIDLINEKLRRIRNKPKLETQLNSIKAELDKLTDEKSKLERELSDVKQESVRKEESLDELLREKLALEERARELKHQKLELEEMNIEPAEYESNEALEALYNKIKVHQHDRADLKSKKDAAFHDLRYRIDSNIADEELFIKFLEEEIACVGDKERSIDGLLKSISTQFANPAYTLLRRYEEFKSYIYNKFNYGLSKTRISDIESLRIELVDNKKLLDEIKAISVIQEFTDQLILELDHESENLKILSQYLDNSRKISFDELFDIELHLDIKGTIKKVDLAHQVESDGTDRMIRLVIIMSIINRLALHDTENKIALFIDEVATIDKHNRPELVKFCRQHQFIPIFAAPDPVPGFSKYYMIYPQKGKITISENVNAIYGERSPSYVNEN
ncbi:MAG: hypothetical protein IT233_05460 [Bacteroidia bacterium]|nr:hypothetical protein [Bacteroidia bacterium]